MSDELLTRRNAATPAGRMSAPTDAANMVRFVVSPEGGWVNGQFLQSDDGFSLFALG